LLLDEPTANMDKASQQLLQLWLMELKEQGKTILISTHFQNSILSLADCTATLENGRITHITMQNAAAPEIINHEIHLARVGS
jgi:ABC-2 type transport system ATP-binding protein